MDPQLRQKIDEFFARYRPKRYSKGQILIHAQDDPECVYHLIEGRVKQYDISYKGDEVVLNVFQPPAFFPMSYAINKTPNKYFFEAETNVELNTVPIEDVVTFIKKNPDVLFDLLARVYRGTDGLLGRMAHLMASSARSRVLYELLIECRRFGKEEDGQYTISLNESELGSRAGLTRETINREIRKLKQDGLIITDHNTMVVTSFSKLSQMIGREL